MLRRWSWLAFDWSELVTAGLVGLSDTSKPSFFMITSNNGSVSLLGLTPKLTFK